MQYPCSIESVVMQQPCSIGSVVMQYPLSTSAVSMQYLVSKNAVSMQYHYSICAVFTKIDFQTQCRGTNTLSCSERLQLPYFSLFCQLVKPKKASPFRLSDKERRTQVSCVSFFVLCHTRPHLSLSVVAT